MSKLIMRRDYEENAEVPCKVFVDGLEWVDDTMSRWEFEQIDRYFQDDVGNVVALFKNGAVIVALQSIDCDWED